MQKTFVGYYTPSEDEFRELWKTARIVLDANVLLATYGVSPATREALLSLLESLRERLWIPHQFALEYQRNRLAKILEQIKHCNEAYKRLKSVLDDELRSGTRHPFVSEQVEQGLDEACAKLLEGKTEQEKLLVSDPHFVRTTTLFEGSVGAPYSDAELGQAHEVARKRYSEKIPPGFKDSDKPEPLRFGDYVGWRQILDFAVKNGASVLLVTDDAKEDWWRIEGARPFGPRPELIAEFRACSRGLFYMYSSDRFLELSVKYSGRAVDPKAINELKERRESEPPTEAIKSTEASISEPPPMKTTSYVSGHGSAGEDLVSDAPKHQEPSAKKLEEI